MIRAGVIGAGGPTALHAQAFGAAYGCTLAGVYSEDTIEAMLGEVDVVAVASEPALRFHHAALAIEHGLDVLIEQPVAPTVESARMLERIAGLRPSRPVVQVSQPDHFNPALCRLAELLEGAAPVAIDFRRLHGGPDGLIHDVHTLVSLARSPLVRLQASGSAGYAVATLVFESGLIGTLTTGQAGPGAAHEVVATTADSVIAVDALAGTIEVSRDGVRERTQVPVGDTLAAQAESFLRAVRERGRPDVDLRTAAACQEVAASVRDCLAAQAVATGVADPRPVD